MAFEPQTQAFRFRERRSRMSRMPFGTSADRWRLIVSGRRCMALLGKPEGLARRRDLVQGLLSGFVQQVVVAHSSRRAALTSLKRGHKMASQSARRHEDFALCCNLQAQTQIASVMLYNAAVLFIIAHLSFVSSCCPALPVRLPISPLRLRLYFRQGCTVCPCSHEYLRIWPAARSLSLPALILPLRCRPCPCAFGWAVVVEILRYRADCPQRL